MNYLLILFISLILITLICQNNVVEPFEYIIINNVMYAVDQIENKEIIVTLPSKNTRECYDLCTTTPKCDGFNFFLNKCDLYKNINHSDSKYEFKKYW